MDMNVVCMGADKILTRRSGPKWIKYIKSAEKGTVVLFMPGAYAWTVHNCVRVQRLSFDRCRVLW